MTDLQTEFKHAVISLATTGEFSLLTDEEIYEVLDFLVLKFRNNGWVV